MIGWENPSGVREGAYKAGRARSMTRALREHWPEYLIEGWALCLLMTVIGALLTILASPKSIAYPLVPTDTFRAVLVALGVGMTVCFVVYSPWGARSGAHMNPAITLAFLRLGKVHPWDAVFYIIAQTTGGVLGVLVVARVGGSLFADPPVSYAITVPGLKGAAVAFCAETLISFALMTTILIFTQSKRLIRFTGLAVGFLLVVLILIEAPLSGASMNPARTLASALPGRMWHNLWIYLLAPPLGMLAAVQLSVLTRGIHAPGCAKLLHPVDVNCIHCGYRPTSTRVDKCASGSWCR